MSLTSCTRDGGTAFRRVRAWILKTHPLGDSSLLCLTSRRRKCVLLFIKACVEECLCSWTVQELSMAKAYFDKPLTHVSAKFSSRPKSSSNLGGGGWSLFLTGEGSLIGGGFSSDFWGLRIRLGNPWIGRRDLKGVGLKRDFLRQMRRLPRVAYFASLPPRNAGECSLS